MQRRINNRIASKGARRNSNAVLGLREDYLAHIAKGLSLEISSLCVRLLAAAKTQLHQGFPSSDIQKHMFLCLTYVWNNTVHTRLSEMKHVHVASRRHSCRRVASSASSLRVNTRQLATDFPRLRGFCAAQVAFSVATDKTKSSAAPQFTSNPSHPPSANMVDNVAVTVMVGGLVDNTAFLLKLRPSIDSRCMQTLRAPASRGRRLTHVARRALTTRWEKYLLSYLTNAYWCQGSTAQPLPCNISLPITMSTVHNVTVAVIRGTLVDSISSCSIGRRRSIYEASQLVVASKW